MFELQGIDNEEFLTYKGRPLVRKDEEIIYGDLNRKHHVKMMIMTEKEVSGFTVPDIIVVQLFEDSNIMPLRQFKAKGLYDALDTAAVWLDGFNK